MCAQVSVYAIVCVCIIVCVNIDERDACVFIHIYTQACVHKHLYL